MFGNCMYAAGCHGDETFTGNVGGIEHFRTAAVVKDYFRLAGGDVGLTEGQIISEWTLRGLANIDQANIYDSLDINPVDETDMRGATKNRGGVLFMFAVPNDWIDNFHTGCIWDEPCTPNPMYGHGVWINGVDSRGYYRVQTWGGWCWMTPGGVRRVRPSAFTVFSHRWYNITNSMSPNNTTWDQDREVWRNNGGGSIPDSPYPTTPPVSPPVSPPPVLPPLPPVTPTDEPQVKVWFSGNNEGQFYKVAPGIIVEQKQYTEYGNSLMVWPNEGKISYTPSHWTPADKIEEPQVQVWFSGNNQGQFYKVAPGVKVDPTQYTEYGNSLLVWPNEGKVSYTPGHWAPKE
jgi:hypothetical protein